MSNVWKKAKVMMLILGFNETIDSIEMACNVHSQSRALRRVDSHVLRRALDIELNGQRKKGRPNRHGRSKLRKEVRMLVKAKKMHIANQSGLMLLI